MITNYKNYIYLKYYNYLYYENANPTEIFAHYRNLVKTSIATEQAKAHQNISNKKTFIQNLEKRLNYFYSPYISRQSSGFTPRLTKEIDQNISEFLGNDVTILKGGKAGFTSMSVNKTQLENVGKKIISKWDSYVNGVEASIKALLTAYSQTANSGESLSRIYEQRLKRLLFLWEKVKKTVLPEDKGKINKNTKEFDNFMEEYNNLLDLYFKQDKNLTGDVGELRTLLILYFLQNFDFSNNISSKEKVHFKGGKNFSNIVLDLFSNKKKGFKWLGHEDSKKGIENIFSFLPVGLNEAVDDIFAGTDFDIKQKGENGELYIKHPTKNKVDIMVTLDSTPLNMSVKNYDLSSKETAIHVVGGTSPLILLQDYMPLISHYLNVASEHGYFNKNQEEYYQKVIQKKKGIVYSNIEYEPPQSTLTDAHETIKSLMFAKALIGGQGQKGKNGFERNETVDILVVNNTNNKNKNNKAPGYYSVYWVEDIINAVMAENSLISLVHRKNNTYTDSNYDGFIRNTDKYMIGADWKNMDSSGQQRMKALYKNFIHQKVTISLKIHSLNKVFNQLKI